MYIQRLENGAAVEVVTNVHTVLLCVVLYGVMYCLQLMILIDSLGFPSSEAKVEYVGRLSPGARWWHGSRYWNVEQSRTDSIEVHRQCL